LIEILDDAPKQQCSAATLSAFSLFDNLEGAERTRIAHCLTRRQYSRNEFVISADQSPNRVYFLLSGRVRACAYSDNGKQVQYEDLTSGMTFGELSVLDGSARSADCIALEESVVLSMSAVDFHQMIASNEVMRNAVLLRLVSMVRQHMQKVFEFSTSSVGERVRLELFRLAADEVPDAEGKIQFECVPTHADIAARISSHREAVTREIKLLENSGVVTWKPGTHVIHAIDRLFKQQK